MAEEILTHEANGIFTIQMNRPEKKNAITQHMYAMMAEGLRTADRDVAVRVVVLRGARDDFSSGNDVNDFITHAACRAEDRPLAAFQFFESMLELRKPLIAAVQGHAIGIGTTMLLHCDLVYAGRSATFGLPFVKLGLCPEFGSSLLLPRLAGQQRAAELFLLGETFTADHARSVGIVNRVLPDPELIETVMAIASRLTQKSPAALLATKKLIKAHARKAVREAIETENQMFFDLMKGPEAAEAFAAFAEKRAPDFSNRD